MVRGFSDVPEYHRDMKALLSSAVAAVLLLTPAISSAYFVDHFQYQNRSTTPGYVQDPSLDLLPGWPDWIGRLNAFSVYLYGRRFNTLTEEQQTRVEQLSRNWPTWIGVPFFLR